MYLRGIAFFCFAILPTSFCYENIHDDRVFDQIQEAILTGADIDRKYEIAPIELSGQMHKRSAYLPSGTRMQIRALGVDIDVWLHPKNSIFAGEDTPVYHAKYAPGKPENVEFVLQKDLMRGVGHLLENATELASVVIGTGEYGGPKVNARLGKRGLVIRSLPQIVVDDYVRKRRSIDGQSDSSNLNYHLVYEDDNSRDTIEETVLRKRVIRAKFSKIPRILYPKILVVVEYNMYSSLKSKHNINGTLEYLLAFWNSVDLKYRSLLYPEIKLNIAGIIFAADPQALSYITKNKPDDGKSLNVTQTMDSATTFFGGIQKTFPLDSYNVAVTMTTLILGDNADDAGLLGRARPMQMCANKPGSKTTDAIAIVYDDNAFEGVHTAAHELGHSFGLSHDGGDGDCPATNGFLMAASPRYTKNSSLFSKCSIKEFELLLETGQLKCLYNRPQRAGKQLPKLSPGKIKNLDDQCKSRGKGVRACTPEGYRQDFDVCVNYWCLRANGECRESHIAALDGTTCTIKNEAEPGFCVRNECVRL